jgi:hypothetical protein
MEGAQDTCQLSGQSLFCIVPMPMIFIVQGEALSNYLHLQNSFDGGGIPWRLFVFAHFFYLALVFNQRQSMTIHRVMITCHRASEGTCITGDSRSMLVPKALDVDPKRLKFTLEECSNFFQLDPFYSLKAVVLDIVNCP